MKAKRLLTTALTLFLAIELTAVTAFAAPPRKREVVEYPSQSETTTPSVDLSDLTDHITIRDASSGEYITDSIYNILCMVVEAEVGSGFEKEAIKAQAVATHSYLIYHAERGATVSCPTKTPKSRVKSCVKAVLDQVMTYDGKVIEAVYCASAAGGTQSSKDYWGGEIPYLQAVESLYDTEGQTHTRTLDLEYVRSWYPESTFPEDPNDWFEILTTNQYGFATTVRAGDQVLSGHDFTSYDHIWMRSCKFTGITYNADSNTFTFSVIGRGHGVGMSQLGANGYAKNDGWSYKKILKHYYTGVTLTTYQGD